MRFARLLCCASVAALLGLVAGTGSLAADAPAAVDYEQDIKPLLRARCYACHGALQQQAELRLDTGELIRKGGDSGAAIVPSDAGASLLVERVSDPDEYTRMPPEGEPLSAEEIALLRAWIQQGAPSPQDEQPETDPRLHWAFQSIRRPSVPELPDSQWVRNPIDAFTAAQHAARGLVPAEQASDPLLARRLYLDLIGLPPEPETLLAIAGGKGLFEQDQWYEKTVDRLLDDPRHGERWGRHWMDIWRYADWWGLGDQLRNSQRHMWHWRDWIVQSLNEDVPYDEMVRLMLAGDELAPTDPQQLRATGFLARNFFLFNRHQWMDEVVEHVSKSFLGLTLNCAKCHDHKYDPFPQEDYFALRAFFEPYHVRLDMLPGQRDMQQNAIPRAFDALLDEPTYVFIRGEETQPDKSRIIAPAVPDVLAFAPPAIEPVQLPPEAWQPERRPWVQEAYLAAAQQAVESAVAALRQREHELAAAQQRRHELAAAEASPTPQETAGAVGSTERWRIIDEFSQLNTDRWKRSGGNWIVDQGRLEQRQDGQSWATLQLLEEIPEDFDLSLSFTIRGGSKWRSVGVGFDYVEESAGESAGSAGESTGSDHEQFVYVSAVEGGSKVQAAYRQRGTSHYPSDAQRSISVDLGRTYTLRVQVRGSLVNASLDGVPMLAWHSPVPRRSGAVRLFTFDAMASFHQVTIESLPADVVLRQPASVDASSPATADEATAAVTIAAARQQLAQRTLAVAEAELESLRRRIDAMKLSWQRSDAALGGAEHAGDKPIDDDLANRSREATAAAVQAERQAKLATAAEKIAEIELRRLQASEDKLAAIDKELAAANENHDKARALVEAEVSPADSYTAISGAQWSVTRFLSSGADDPAITFPSRSSGRRTALAQWITDPRNPLTARVAVNHIWTRHMGTPLVQSVFDFGRAGAEPTHRELLDYLASELIDSGWSMKHIHRLIVTSATYRMSSSVAQGEANEAIDPENRYWWRRSSSRVEAQVVRDAILHLAGTLDLAAGGPSVPPAAQAESKRRSLYFFHSNNDRNLFLTTFDEAAVTECYRRQESIVPQQALALTNSALVLDAIGPIAERLEKHLNAAGEDAAFVRLGFLTLLGTSASDEELSAATDALTAWQQQDQTTRAQARAYLVWALLNHNDFVTLR